MHGFYNACSGNFIVGKSDMHCMHAALPGMTYLEESVHNNVTAVYV